MLKILMSLFIVYGCVLLLLFLFQRSFIYYPHKLHNPGRYWSLIGEWLEQPYTRVSREKVK